jgi:hypothetical protein
MVFAGETLRRALGLGRTFILVADRNAASTGLGDLDVQRSRARLRATLEAVYAQLAFPVTILSASELRHGREIEALARRLPAPNHYIALQLAQMEHMRRMNAAIKLGWAAPGFDNDETAFDRLFDRLLGQPLAYLYTRAGRTLDPGRLRCSPYVCQRREARVLLERGENIAAKLAAGAPTPAVRGYRRLLTRLARAHRHLVGPDRPGPPIERLQSVLDGLTV